MKKNLHIKAHISWLLLSLLYSFFGTTSIFGQCENPNAYLTFMAPTAPGVVAEISTCTFTIEYNTISNVPAGTTFVSDFSGAGFITVREGTSGGPVVGFGPAPLIWTSNSAGSYYVHYTNDAMCNGSFGCNTTTIMLAPTPNTPPVPTQDPGVPSCLIGSNLNVVGSPEANVSWYWQSTANGTSLASSTASPLTVFSNGTYYVRGYNSLYGNWGDASSISVSNFSNNTAPAVPTADQNPACTPGTNINLTSPMGGFTYYWQGTNVNGLSTALNASTPYFVNNTGTYYIRSLDAGNCWSPPTAISITVNSTIPNAPLASVSNYNYCTSETPMNVSAQIPVQTGNVLFDETTNVQGLENSGLMATVNVPTPTGAVSSAVLNFSTGGYCGYSYSATILVDGIAVATGICDQNNFDLMSFLPFNSVSVQINSTNSGYYPEFLDVDCNVVMDYVGALIPQPAMTIDWYANNAGGSIIGTGTTINGLGTTVLPVAASGLYTFYAETDLGGCNSATRTPVTISVVPVNVTLNPVNVSCNGLNNGSFALTSTLCGTAPFEYSVNGGSFGPIPTNLTPGTYTVVVREQATPANTSGAYTIVITEPGAPDNLNEDNTSLTTATLSWDAQGNETEWIIEYGLTGFLQGSGQTATATSNPFTITGLTPGEDYDFYVRANCVVSSDFSDLGTFSTLAPFMTYDNSCGQGFVDISTTGTDLFLTDDSFSGQTIPFTLSYQGQNITTLSVSNNGGIVLGTLNGFVQYGNLNFVGGSQLSAWADDLDEQTGNVYWQVVGTAPNRIAIAQWNNSNNYDNGPGTVRFQIQMHETSNEIYYIYDDVLFGGSESFLDYGSDADIGFSGPVTDVNISNNNASYLQANSCVRIYETNCPNVTGITANTTVDEALIDWSVSQFGETDWTIVYGLEGFDPTQAGQVIGTLTSSSSDINILNLTQLTAYDAYIYTECTLDGNVSDGALITFVTKPLCADITNLNGNTQDEEIDLTWNYIANLGYDIQSFNIIYATTGMNLFDGDEVLAVGTNNADSIISSNLLPSGVYDVYVQAVCATGDTSSFVGPLTVVMPITNDLTCEAPELMVDETIYVFNNEDATVELGEVSIAPDATGPQETDGWANSNLNGTLWYKFTAPASGQVRINSTAIEYNGQIAVYSTVDCNDFNAFTLIAANDDDISGSSVAPNFTICGLTSGQTYYIMFDGFNFSEGNFAISLKEINLNAGTTGAPTSLCTGSILDLMTTISNEGLGGVWSSNLPAVNASISGSNFNSGGLAYAMFNFEYRLTDGCAFDSIISQVEIFGPSTAGEDGSLTACQNEPINLYAGLNGNVDHGGQWYDPSNNQVSDDITSASFQGQYNYDYVVSNGVCAPDTANVVVTVGTCNYLSVDELAFEGVEIYPNPTTGTLNIVSENDYQLVISDANGRIIDIEVNKVLIGTTTVDLQNIEPGVYFVTLSNDKVSKVFNIVVQ